MNPLTRGIGWALLLSAILYFSYGVAYHVGYTNGYASKKCELHNCMEHVIKYGSCNTGRTSNYPMKANYKGVK